MKKKKKRLTKAEKSSLWEKELRTIYNYILNIIL